MARSMALYPVTAIFGRVERDWFMLREDGLLIIYYTIFAGPKLNVFSSFIQFSG